MSSITVGDLKAILERFPEDYEVIVQINHLERGERKHEIMYINAISEDKEYGEVRLEN